MPDRFDAIVVGGGIQGLTFAEEAGRRGRRTLLLEAAAFGSASTAASLGIVHGGFRYWQELDAVRLLRSRREQAWFMRQFAPLVQPLRCLMPFYSQDPAKPALFAAAATADRALHAGLGRSAPALRAPRLLGRRALLEEAPWLASQRVLAAGEWHDVEIVDVPGLVEALLRRATAQRAVCLSETEVIRVLLGSNGEVAGVEAADRASGAPLRAAAPVVVNCSGAALGRLAGAAHPAGPRFFQPLPAYNLHLPEAPPLGAAFAVGPGKRLFLRPRADGILAGTFYGPPDTEPDVSGWLRALDDAAPGLNLQRAGRPPIVLAGVVPAGATAIVPAKRDVVLDHGAAGGPRGLFSLSGVKLTTARWLSQQAAARIWPGGAHDPGEPSDRIAGAGR